MIFALRGIRTETEGVDGLSKHRGTIDDDGKRVCAMASIGASEERTRGHERVSVAAGGVLG